MKVRRRITGALAGFLHTYISRYTDMNGYWLWGQLVLETSAIELQILPEDAPLPVLPISRHATILARKKILEQLDNHHIPRHFVKEAKLRIEKKIDESYGWIEHQRVKGNLVVLTIDAVSDLEKKYSCYARMFVSPHDPAIERQTVEEYITPLLK